MTDCLMQDGAAKPGGDAPALREQRFACVGIALVYSARDDRGQPELGKLLHQAATHDMSLKGMSFDVATPMAAGETLAVLVGQPDSADCEQLLTTVCWCRPVAAGHFRIGVQINQSRPVLRQLSPHQTQALLADQVGQPVPSSVELTCPACGAHATFELVHNQPVAGQAGLMPLYDCSVCETTRSIMGLLAYARQTGAAPASLPAPGPGRIVSVTSAQPLPFNPTTKETHS